MYLRAALRASDDTKTASFSTRAARAVDRRGSVRRPLRLEAIADAPEQDQVPVLVRDISPSGLLLEAEPEALLLDDQIQIEIPERGTTAARVAWKSGRFAGCEFAEPIATAAVSAALLTGEPAPSNEQQSQTTPAQIGPELNFSVAFLLAVALWAVIAAAVYLYLLAT